MIKKIFILFSLLLLIYMTAPGPSKISDFKSLPDSDRSTLAGDTSQIPNVSAYFSNNFRNFVGSFYLKDYKQLTWLPFPPIILNHPPEFSWNVIKRHTDSTYLEEILYPLRDSLYVNGFEPFYEDGSPKFWGSSKLNEGNNLWYTKTTLRFFPSSFFARLGVWLGITLSIMFLYRLGKRIIL
jgi:hypothetical protein